MTSSDFMRRSSRHPDVPHDWLAQKNGKSGTHCWGGGVDTICTVGCQTTVTAHPRVDCAHVVWSHLIPLPQLPLVEDSIPIVLVKPGSKWIQWDMILYHQDIVHPHCQIHQTPHSVFSPTGSRPVQILHKTSFLYHMCILQHNSECDQNSRHPTI